MIEANSTANRVCSLLWSSNASNDLVCLAVLGYKFPKKKKYFEKILSKKKTSKRKETYQFCRCFVANVNRSGAVFCVFFFLFFAWSSAHSSHNAFDYKFNILCIISTLASFITIFSSTPFGRRWILPSAFYFLSFFRLFVCFFFYFRLRLFYSKVIRIRHRRWFCQLHQLPFLNIRICDFTYSSLAV